MQVSHTTDVLQSPALWRLAQFIQRQRQKWQSSDEASPLEDFEKALHDHVMALECDLLADELSRYDVDTDHVSVEGITYHRAMTSQATYISAAGPVSVERHLYRPSGRSSKSICPLELQAGIVSGLFTPRAARHGAFVLAHMTPREASALFSELGGMQPSVSTLDRLPKVLSSHFEANRETWEDTLREAETVPCEAAVVAVSLDGVMVPMQRCEQDEPSEASRKQESVFSDDASKPSRSKNYREAGCGTVTLYTKQGERLDTVRYGRMPEYKKATLCAQLEAECQSIMAPRPDLNVVKLADGADENWRFLESLDLGLEPSEIASVHQVCIVDFYHASEHLKTACDAIFGEGSVESKATYAHWRTLLKEDDQGVAKIIARLRYRLRQSRGKRRQRIDKELTYFCNQRHRMRYSHYIRQNLPIGSGIVEAACKTLVTGRLKRSGMRWSKAAGGQAILSLRSVIQSGRWGRAWSLVRDAFRKPVVMLCEGDLAENPAA